MVTKLTGVRTAVCGKGNHQLTHALDGKYGARLVRLSSLQDFSFHDIALVDGESATFEPIMSAH